MKALFFAATLVLAARVNAVETKTEEEPIADAPVAAINYSAGVIGKNDVVGTLYGPFAAVNAKQKLYQDFTAEVLLRMYKNAGNDSDTVGLSLERAQLQYVGRWLTFGVGRREMSALLSPSSYFGPMATMGESQFDAASLSFRFRLQGDIPDSDQSFNAPENSLTFIYVPSPFSQAKSLYDGSQGLFITRMTASLQLAGTLSQLGATYVQFQDTLFRYSSYSGNPAFEVGYSLTLAKYYRLFADYTIQNSAVPGTASIVSGLDFTGLNSKVKVAERITIEYLSPVGGDQKNAFTGGNTLSPTAGTLPQGSLFIRIHNRLGSARPTDPARFYYGVAATNNTGDYTLARLRAGTTAAVVPPAYGAGQKVEYMPFRSKDWTTYSYLFYAGYEF